MSTALASSLPLPGKVVKLGHQEQETVLTIQDRLNETGCGPIEEDGDFGKNTEKRRQAISSTLF